MKPPSSLTTAAIAVALAGLCGCAAAHGEVRVSEVDVPFEMGSSFQPAGSASIKQEISDGGESYWLLPTFDDRDAALENVRREAPDAVAALESRNFWLGPLSGWNWGFYRDALNGCADDLGGGEDVAGQVALLRAFFDIYENDDENAAIVDRARREGLGAVMADLPDQSTLAESVGQGQ
ncbi:hypothetical protein [Adlercreutzia caecimuris]|uniref:hypothetical protein n=1 Tax=Adlercreutzia caecimuris TaxID=671266 RepID=UPI0024957C68|nr:hypothetical protein [Adlercreutzia caecimuris]